MAKLRISAIKLLLEQRVDKNGARKIQREK
jgi:hypothetical protein